MIDDLTRLSAVDIDALPFGYIALNPDGEVRKYNRFEADLARKDPRDVLGRNFFREVAPCTAVREFEGRFRDFAAGASGDDAITFDFEFAFRHGRQKVRIGLVRSPLEQEIIVTVNRVRDLRLPTSPELTADPLTGGLSDANGLPVMIANADFWLALHEVAGATRRELLTALGRSFGTRHAARVDRLVQRERGAALREVELHLAIESLSGSASVLGLGHFDVDLSMRSQGILRIDHANSPFPRLLADAADAPAASCAFAAGFHAAFLSHLAGRRLDAIEVACAGHGADACTFLAGTPERLARLATRPDEEDPAVRAVLGARGDALAGAER